jgi:hypothetical protein
MRPTRAGAVPAFSADELQQFLTSNIVPLGIKGTPNSINRVDCSLNARKVSTILRGKAIAVPADTPVCYAELRGDFTFSLPPSRRPGQPTSITFHKGFRVYDAKTGNILASGAFE